MSRCRGARSITATGRLTDVSVCATRRQGGVYVCPNCLSITVLELQGPDSNRRSAAYEAAEMANFSTLQRALIPRAWYPAASAGTTVPDFAGLLRDQPASGCPTSPFCVRLEGRCFVFAWLFVGAWLSIQATSSSPR